MRRKPPARSRREFFLDWVMSFCKVTAVFVVLAYPVVDAGLRYEPPHVFTGTFTNEAAR